MRKLTLILIFLTGLVITACAPKVQYTAVVDEQAVKAKAKYVQKHWDEIQKAVNFKAMEDEITGWRTFKVGVASETQAVITKIPGPIANIAAQMALEKTYYRNTWVVITDYLDKSIHYPECRFRVELKFANDDVKDKWYRRWGISGGGLDYNFKRFSKKYEIEGRGKGRITGYIIDAKAKRSYTGLFAAYPFINSVWEVYVGDRLAGRFIAYGSAKFTDILGRSLPIFSFFRTIRDEICGYKRMAEKDKD